MANMLEATELVVDYPREDERIPLGTYAFRIAGKDADRVEVSINGSLWQPCRFAGGYWWYDWANYLPGWHQVIAKAQMKDGRTITSYPRRFLVPDRRLVNK